MEGGALYLCHPNLTMSYYTPSGDTDKVYGEQQHYGGRQPQQYGSQPQEQQYSQYGMQQQYPQTGGYESGWHQQQQSQFTNQQHYYNQNQFVTQQPRPIQNVNGTPTTVPPKQSQTPAFWNPAAAATMAAMAASTVASGNPINNDAVLDFASKAGKSFLQNGTARMIPGLESSMLALRSYFAVDNKYVLRKMKRILFPVFMNKEGWQRQVRDPSTPEVPTSYALPVFDVCAPDLYLPVMSLITYVLLSALCYGTAGKFNPEVIPDVAFKCALYQTLEVLIFWGGFYSMQVPVAFLDLYSYTGYKYLGLCANMIAGIIVGHFGFGSYGYYGCFLWTATAAAYFMLKTMSNNIPLYTAPTGPKREFMVIAFAALQYFTMWMVSQTKFL